LEENNNTTTILNELEVLNNIINKAADLIESVEEFEEKQTKVKSKEIRKIINDLKKLATPAKKELLEFDNKPKS